jgi:hypothetical protein
MFCNFDVDKNHNIGNNSTNTEAREQISWDLESLEYKNFMSVPTRDDHLRHSTWVGSCLTRKH